MSMLDIIMIYLLYLTLTIDTFFYPIFLFDASTDLINFFY